MTPKPSASIAYETLDNVKYLWCKFGSSPSRRLVVVIPGNPGIICVYSKFALFLNEYLNCDICVQGHPGHCGHSDRTFDLEDCINRHAEGLVSHLEEGKGYEGVVVMGHSIGAYMAIAAHNRCPPSLRGRVQGIGALAGTLTRFAPERHYPCALLCGVPEGARILIRAFLKRMPSFLFPSKEAHDEILSGFFPQSIVTLLRSELATLPHELQEDLLDQAKGKVFAIYAPHDPYVAPQAQIKVGGYLRKAGNAKDTPLDPPPPPAGPGILSSLCGRRLGGAPHYHPHWVQLRGMQHGFVLFEEESRAVASKAAEWILNGKFNEPKKA